MIKSLQNQSDKWQKISVGPAPDAIVPEIKQNTTQQQQLIFTEIVLLDSASLDAKSQRFPVAEVCITGAPSALIFKFDIGAEANFITEAFRKSITPTPKLLPTHQSLWGYGGARINCIGTCLPVCSVNKKQKQLLFHVIDQWAIPIFSYQACLDFGLLSITNLSVNELNRNKFPEHIQKYEKLFKGQSKMDGLVKIYTRPKMRPVVQPPRRVSFTLQTKLKDKGRT